MSKKNPLITLIILSIPGAVICFYATNLVLSDIANMFYMAPTKDFISSIPIFFIGIEFVMAAINFLHLALYPTEMKRLLRLNAIAFTAISLIGAVCSILTGIIIYGSFAAPYPFPAATIITLMYHLIMVILASFVICRCGKTDPSAETAKTRIRRAVQWLLSVIFIYYAFDRLGAVILAVTYAQTSTLYKTIPFYISLLIPVLLLLHHCLYRLDLYRNRHSAGIKYSIIYLAAHIALSAYVFAIGSRDTQFVAAISPALGIERLLTKPIITIVHFILLTLPIIATLLTAAIRKAKQKS